MHACSCRSLVLAISVGLFLTGIAAAQVNPSHPETMPRVAPGPPLTYGTSQTSYVTVSEQEFVPTDSATTYGDVSGGSFNLQRFKTAGDSGFIAAVHLPGGAVLMSIEFDFCDSSTTNQHWVAAVL